MPATDWLRAHVPVKLPEPGGDTEKLTKPVGVIGFPFEVSFTVAVQLVD